MDETKAVNSPLNQNSATSARPIFLIGFMGAGKTTVGQALAANLKFQFIDLDHWIELQAGKTVPELFAQFGEAYFRHQETSALEACAGFRNSVISVGGGAFSIEENRRIIQSAGHSIWLDCSLEVVISRIQFDGTRPLARSKEELSALLLNRIPAYRQADFTVQVDDKTVDEVVQSIQQILRESDSLPLG